MTFGIILYDDDRRIVAIDETAASIFQLPSAELIGRRILDFVPQPDREQMAEARATFERFGEAAGQYGLEREDGSLQSIVYRVLANAPIARLNLMALSASDPGTANTAAQIRRVGQDVHAGLDVSQDERWFGSGAQRMASAPPRAPEAELGGSVIAAVFPTEEDAWAALLAAQHGIEARLEMGLTSFDGGWPRDRRSVLAVRGADDHRVKILGIIAEFEGTLLSGDPMAEAVRGPD
jgi:PAS domain-containing protein